MQCKQAVDSSYAIVDRAEQRLLKEKLSLIEGTMFGINVLKISIMKWLDDFLDKGNPILTKRWDEIRESCASTSRALSDLNKELENDKTVLVRGTDLITASSLGGALS